MTTRSVVRICPFCGKEGITLYMGGYTGRLYKCPNCQYLGPIILEGEQTEEEPITTDNSSGVYAQASTPGVQSERYIANLSKLSSTLNKAGLLFGLAFMAIGVAVALWLQPPTSVSRSGSVRETFGWSIFIIGAFLTAVSGLFLLIDRLKTLQKSSD